MKRSATNLRKLIIGATVAIASFAAVAGCFNSKQCDSEGRCITIRICHPDPTPPVPDVPSI